MLKNCCVTFAVKMKQTILFLFGFLASSQAWILAEQQPLPNREPYGTTCDHSPCSHVCVEFGGGFYCECPIGYHLGFGDYSTCVPLVAAGAACNTANCSHGCVTFGDEFFCECAESYRIADDYATCVLRDSEADCPTGFLPYGHSCMASTHQATSYAGSEAACRVLGGRLVKIHDQGVRRIVGRYLGSKKWIGVSDRTGDGSFVNSDGSRFTYDEGWATGQPEIGSCVYISDSKLFTGDCEHNMTALCEIPRATGFVVFSNRVSWKELRGTLYFPTDVNAVLVTFPQPVKEFYAWFSTVSKRLSSSQYVVKQNDIERQFGKGHGKFVIEMGGSRFPDYKVAVTPYAA